MLELKFAIYYGAASLPSQASYVVLAEESQAFFKHSPHTNSISNSAILHNNYISLLSNLCACVHVKKNVTEAIYFFGPTVYCVKCVYVSSVLSIDGRRQAKGINTQVPGWWCR